VPAFQKLRRLLGGFLAAFENASKKPPNGNVPNSRPCNFWSKKVIDKRFLQIDSVSIEVQITCFESIIVNFSGKLWGLKEAVFWRLFAQNLKSRCVATNMNSMAILHHCRTMLS
jgi:hypothetical protein